MNQGRIWCVVNPTVGLPLLLGSVALTSLAVHTAVMTHVSWMGNYWQGAARTRVTENSSSALASTALSGQPAYVLSIAPVAAVAGNASTSFVVTVAANPASTASVAVPEAAKPAQTAMNAR